MSRHEIKLWSNKPRNFKHISAATVSGSSSRLFLHEFICFGEGVFRQENNREGCKLYRLWKNVSSFQQEFFTHFLFSFISKWKMGGYRQDVFHGVKGYLEAWVHPFIIFSRYEVTCVIISKTKWRRGSLETIFCYFLKKNGRVGGPGCEYHSKSIEETCSMLTSHRVHPEFICMSTGGQSGDQDHGTSIYPGISPRTTLNILFFFHWRLFGNSSKSSLGFELRAHKKKLGLVWFKPI